MDHFAEIRSLLNRTEWDMDLLIALKRACEKVRSAEPILWMTQISPYVASFTHKWDTIMALSTSNFQQIQDWYTLFPCAWFEFTVFSSITVLKPQRVHTRIRSLGIRTKIGPKGFLHHFPNLTHFGQVGGQFNTNIKIGSKLATKEDLPQLTHLRLRHVNLFAQDLHNLHDIGFLDSLTHLNLSGNVHLASLPPLPKTLTHLTILRTDIPADTIFPDSLTVYR